MVRDLLLVRGRASRASFVAICGAVCGGWVLGVPASSVVAAKRNATPVITVVLAVVVWVLLGTAIRRLHDLDKHPVLLLLGFLPVVNLALAAYLALAPGDVGPNRHGPPPQPTLVGRWLTVGAPSNPGSPTTRSEETQNDPALRRFAVGLLVVVLILVGGFATIRHKYVDTTEYEVLEDHIDPVVDSAGFITTSTRRGDPSPCWWWCEDRVLNVDVRLRILPKQSAANDAELCSALREGLGEGLGRTADFEEEWPSGACSMHWADLRVDGRDVSVWAVIGPWPEMGADLVITNESAERAFLPQCWLWCP